VDVPALEDAAKILFGFSLALSGFWLLRTRL